MLRDYVLYLFVVIWAQPEECLPLLHRRVQFAPRLVALRWVGAQLDDVAPREACLHGQLVPVVDNLHNSSLVPSFIRFRRVDAEMRQAYTGARMLVEKVSTFVTDEKRRFRP